MIGIYLDIMGRYNRRPVDGRDVSIGISHDASFAEGTSEPPFLIRWKFV